MLPRLLAGLLLGDGLSLGGGNGTETRLISFDTIKAWLADPHKEPFLLLLGLGRRFPLSIRKAANINNFGHFNTRSLKLLQGCIKLFFTCSRLAGGGRRKSERGGEQIPLPPNKQWGIKVKACRHRVFG